MITALLFAAHLYFVPVTERDNTHLLVSAVWASAFAELLEAAHEDDSESD